VTYVDGNFIETKRRVRIESVSMDRHETRIDSVCIDTGERRQLRLDRIQHAEISIEPEPAAAPQSPKRRA